jgi:hypothetical protein
MFVTHETLNSRVKAAGIHLIISISIAALAAALVFGLWYPYPYREISGGRELFLLVVAVDVIMGPLLTLAIFNRNKTRRMLMIDLGVVGLLQIAALVYGLWTVSAARPVHLAFEFDRFRVVHAIDIPESLLDKAPPALRDLPLSGPTPLAVREFRSSKESFDATMAAVRGLSLGARPDLWQTYQEARPRVLAALRPLDDLKKRFPARAIEIDQALQKASPPAGTAIGYLPMVGRSSFWTVLVDTKNAEIIAFVPVDSF